MSSSARPRIAILAAVSLLLCGPSAILAVAGPASVVSVGCRASALVDAITNAERSPGADSIRLKAGCTYTLTRGSFDGGVGPNGLPFIRTPITIDGNGATIARAAGAPPFRLFQVNRGGVLTLEHVTLRGGRAGPAEAPGENGQSGGAILVIGGTLDATRVAFTGNTAGSGGNARGTIVNGGKGGSGGAIATQSNGRLSMSGASFVGNAAGRGGRSTLAGGRGGDGGEGGAISIANGKGSVQVVGSSFSSNAAGGGGPGVAAGGGGGRGGAVFTEGVLSVAESMFTSNRAGSAASGWPEGGGFGTGGAISAWEAGLTVTNSTFTGNAALSGGAIWSIYGEHPRRITLVAGSTFSGNTSASTGGGIILLGGTLTVTNSTFTGNRAGAGGSSGGGAIFINSGTADVTNTTVSGNTASGGGGGLFAGGATTLRNTIVAGNTTTGTGVSSPDNCDAAPESTVVDGGGNLRWPADDPSCVGGFGDPKLLPLDDNGGTTRTMAPGPGSAVIDTASDATCAASAGPAGRGAGARDQRGVARPKGTHCDVGAVEFAPLHHLALAPDPATIDAGGSSAYAAEGRSASNEDLGDATPETTFSISPDGSCAGNTCTAIVPGHHTVTGTFGAAVGTAALQVKLTQTITFGVITNKTLAQSPLTIAATASSGLQVRFSTTTSSVCRTTGAHGATLALLRPGMCIVKANQAGNATYEPAETVTRSFRVR
jgi:hypothetical protein